MVARWDHDGETIVQRASVQGAVDGEDIPGQKAVDRTGMPNKRYIEAATTHPPQEIPASCEVRRDRHPRLSKTREHTTAGVIEIHGQSDANGKVVGPPAGTVDKNVCLVHKCTRVRQQGGPCRRQHHTASITIKQALPKVTLKALDTLRQRWLGHRETGSRIAEMAMISDRQKK